MRVFPKGLLFVLLAGAALLPMAITLVVATSFLFAGLHDVAVAKALNGVALGLGLFWVLNLVALVLSLSLDAIAKPDSAAEQHVEEE